MLASRPKTGDPEASNRPSYQFGQLRPGGVFPMKRFRLFIAALVSTVVLGGCGSTHRADGSPEPTPTPIPNSISSSDLLNARTPATPVNDAAFSLPTDAAAPDESFEGRLTLANPVQNGSFQVVDDAYGQVAGGDSPWKHLPPFSFEFVQDAGYLIPAQQGLVYTGHPTWNYIVGPGRVWKQSDDSGYTRASFPFALVEMNQNCVHNGVMTFLFSNARSPNISNVRYQVTQETCQYSKFNLWGQIAATYTPYSLADGATIRSDNAAEVANRLPTKPLSALTTDFPGSGVNPAALVSDYRYPEDITTYGLLFNGVNYVSGCHTRFGEYAYCSEIRLPSYSTAKSAFNNVAAMRLGQIYGTGVYGQLVRDYLPEYTVGGDWASVTFDHALDMATGNFLSSAYMSDENGPENQGFIQTLQYSVKIDRAFRLFPHRAAPGTVWVYQDVAAFIGNQAMNRYLQEQQGSDADIFNLVRDDVYKPLQISKGGLTTLRTDNSATGKALGFMGLFYIQDDIVKIAKLLNNDAGAIGGSQVLEPSRLRESLYREPSVLGLPVPDTGPTTVPSTYRYNNSVWAKRMTRTELPQYGCEFWVPYMSGYGGISVAMLPNGATFYVFSDRGEYSWAAAANEANKLAPICASAHALRPTSPGPKIPGGMDGSAVAGGLRSE
jgi:hypothetical protein